jgi:hypothetical protein
MRQNEQTTAEDVAPGREPWKTPSWTTPVLRTVRASNAEHSAGSGPDVESIS